MKNLILNIKKVSVIIVLIVMGINFCFGQNVYTVTKTDDPDPFLYFVDPNDPEIVGTLQWAVRSANDAADSSVINFDIPGTGPHIIYLNYSLPTIIKQVKIDGSTQAGYQTGIPAVIVDGQLNSGFYFAGNTNCAIKGLYITNFFVHGIIIYGDNYKILDNVVNQISRGQSTYLTMGVRIQGSQKGIIQGNYIGTDINSSNLGNEHHGIAFLFSPSNSNIIGGTGPNEANTIAYNGSRGIWIGSGNYNKISGNRIYDNPKGISLIGGGNQSKQKPVITALSPTGVLSGTAQPNDIIEIFGSTGSENANEYLQTVVADGSGNWNTSMSNFNWTYFIATATDILNNTSEFSNAFEILIIPGNICETAIETPVTDTYQPQTYQMTDTVKWFKFTPDTSAVTINISQPDTLPYAQIQALYLYEGQCGNLNLIKEIDSLIFTIDSLVPGLTYYIELERNIQDTGYFNLRIYKALPLALCVHSDYTSGCIDYIVPPWSCLDPPILYLASVCVGDTLVFCVLNVGANPQEPDACVGWNFFGVTPLEGTPGCIPTADGGGEFTVVYNSPGTYYIQATIFDEPSGNILECIKGGIIVIEEPQPSFTIEPDGGPFCVGSPICVTTSSADYAGIDGYDFGGWTEIVSGCTPVGPGGWYCDTTFCIKYYETGTYDITLTKSNGVCDRSVTQTINVVDVISDFTFDTVCHGDIVHFINLTNCQPANYNWVWDFGDGTPDSDEQNPTHVYDNYGDYDVTLMVYDEYFSVLFNSVTHTVTTLQPTENYTATTSGVWMPGDNPFNDTSDDVDIKDELIIQAGVSITIENMNFKFGPDAEVILESGSTSSQKGAELTLKNHTTFTSYNVCDSTFMWKGIFLDGSNTDQYPLNTTQQPVLWLKNSTIENAEIAVKSESGGIVKALYSDFINNEYGVVFTNFVGNSGDYESKNASAFHHCNFITDAYLNDPAKLPVAFVDMEGISYIIFNSNTFKNTASYGILEKGTGINSFNSTYKVSYNNHFEGLYYGIDASASNSLYTVTIAHNEFIDNFRGVKLSNIDYEIITKNNFQVPPWYYYYLGTLESPYGLYLENCTGFQVEENDFYTNFGSTFIFGLIIRESETDYVVGEEGEYNKIYRNTFHGSLFVSAEALDQNDGGLEWDGLQFLCNDFTNNRYDIAVIDGDIGHHQGYCDGPNHQAPAGNRFSLICWGMHGQYFFDKPSFYTVDYAHHIEDANNNAEPECYDDEFLKLSNCNVSFVENGCDTCSCPSHLNQGIDIIKENITVYKEKVEELKALIDGGDTQYLLDIISQGNPGHIKNTLKKYSPYISDEVLIAAINSGLPPGILKQIIIANSPVSDEVMEALNNISIPNGIMNQINNAQTGASAMEELKDEIGYYNSQKEFAINDLIRLYLNDTIPDRIKKVIEILKKQERVTAKRQLINAYIIDKEYSKAELLIDSLYTTNVDLENLYKLKSLIIELKQAGETIEKLKTDTLKEQIVREIAEDTTHNTHFIAQNILKYVFDENCPEKIVLPEENNNKSAFFNTEDDNSVDSIKWLDENHKLTNFPNPFTRYTTIEVFVPEYLNNAELVIYNLLGVIIKKYPLEKGYNAITVLSDEIPYGGIYLYSLISGDRRLAVGKMTLIK